MNDYIHIGKIVATFGLKGELILQHALEKKTTFKTIDAVFIEEKKSSCIPYFIQSSKAKNNIEINLQLEGVDTKEAAHNFIQKQVWLLEEDFRKIAGKKSIIALLGFHVINEGEKLGVVEEIIQQPHQVLLRITLNNKEVLIPLHTETLKKIDRKKQEVYVTLPDGLLDVYN